MGKTQLESGCRTDLRTGFALEVAKACHAEGISVALDTSGYGDYEQFVKLAEEVDLILFDVKAGTESRHFELTGVSLEAIRGNLDYCDTQQG